jgi:meso-butanediol dehydrogenase/(S,S)-butanediol dehydrogenase/diacetyl reductase
MFDTNAKSCFWMTKHAMPYLQNAAPSAIINNASVAGMQSYASGVSYAYSASKSAVIQFSRILALNYAKHGVRVNTICPGIIQTPVYGKDVSDASWKIPLGRVGQPEEVADLVLFLASQESAYIVGAVIPIDGGLTV